MPPLAVTEVPPPCGGKVLPSAWEAGVGPGSVKPKARRSAALALWTEAPPMGSKPAGGGVEVRPLPAR